MSCFPARWAYTGWRQVRGGLLALPLLGCGGTTGDVLSAPDPGAPLGTVPAGCADGHEDGLICWQQEGWATSAAAACQARGQVLVARVLLDLCGTGYYRGVYYRCCPAGSGP